ncbi:lipoprotein [Spiroplasma endosymbiont of Ammophila pubescens]|uniref:lipoprotein n=1 Tax=Spiroplasma endosymbiont of Ammophila pubescens TaxID=3066315 RepID=UPI0032B1673B
MKKWLSILGAIGLTATSTTSLKLVVINQNQIIIMKTVRIINLNLHQNQKNHKNHQKIVIEN